MKFGWLIFFLVAPTLSVALDAHYAAPVERYGHNVLGDTPEWSQLCVDDQCAQLPDDMIFEDIAPSAIDLDGDGRLEVITVMSKIGEGASLAIFDDQAQLITQTPYIGTQNRWLAPIGAADFDQDGVMDVAYVETPHIGGVLKIWSYQGGALQLVLETQYFTNHKIGENFITSDIRACEDRDEILLLNQERSAIMALGYVPKTAKPYAAKIADFTDENWAKRQTLPCPVLPD